MDTMQIPVLVEPISGNGFRARSGEPLALTAEGATRDEALEKLRDLVQSRLVPGAEIVSLFVPGNQNPWVDMAGMFKDNPLFREVVEIMAEQRREADGDPDYL
jgi:hypothetical protein